MDSSLASFVGAASAAAWNVYGPTETTIWSSSYRLEKGKDVHLGRPISNTQMYLLDERLWPVVTGFNGELHIGGDGLARGYLARPGLTAERFIPNPYGEPGSRMYRSGDICRRLPDESLHFAGRFDQQVKVRGFRIELGEIDSALLECQGVREAMTAALEDGASGKRLVAYVVPKSNAVTAATLRAQLSERLPTYMIPAAWIFLESMPLSPSGKIDRQALKGRLVDEHFVAERPVDDGDGHADVLDLVMRFIQEIAPTTNPSPNDDFFDLGFHSMDLMRLVMRCRQHLDIRLTVGNVARTRSIREFVRVVQEHIGRRSALADAEA